jgi:thiol-disulfide isomerase/thioredoxin
MWQRTLLLVLVQLYALFLCVVDARGRGRGRGRSRGHGGRRNRGGSDEEDPMPAPPVVKFVHATELDGDGFLEQVETVANSSGVSSSLLTLKQPYFPFVLFHVSWCQHCRHTLPEFERAAEMINKSNEEGKLKGLEAPVKYFLIQCDSSPENMRQCEKHAGTAFPVLKLFRDKRAYQFNGPRWGKTMGEWSAHVSRPIVLQVSKKSEMNIYTEHGTLFMMKAEAAANQMFLHAWFELAYQYLEDFYFCVVPTDSELNKTFPAKQSVTVRGKGIEALPMKGKMDVDKMEQWVKLNRWPIVVDMTPEVAIKLVQGGRRVVAFAYKYRRGVKLDSQEEGQVYRQKATELRRKHDLIFASMDCSVRDNSEFLGNLFSVISPPTLFVFMGNGSLKSEVVYWEDPGLQAADLSIESIEELINSSWARQDNTTGAWAKGWTKKVSRFGTGSFIGFIVVILLPLAFSGLCCLCIKELMTSDEQQTEEQKENQEQIRRMLQSRPTSTKRRAGKGFHGGRIMNVAREVTRSVTNRDDRSEYRTEYARQPVTQPPRMEQPTPVTQAAVKEEATREIEGIDEDDSQPEDLDDTAGPGRQISEEPPQELMDESTPKDENLTKRR